MHVLHVDNHLLVVAKPAGLPVVPDESGDESLLETAKAWVAREFKKPGAVFLGVVHRLDRPVSGLVVFARTSKGAARLSAAFRERRIEKRYLAVSAQAPAEREGTLVQWLAKDREANRVRAFERPVPDAREARTHWRVLARVPGRVLLELVPETGRPHQLRVAAKTLGAPLLGDTKYGAAAPLPDRSVALHAERLALEHPTRGERLAWTLEPPDLACWRFPGKVGAG